MATHIHQTNFHVPHLPHLIYRHPQPPPRPVPIIPHVPHHIFAASTNDQEEEVLVAGNDQYLLKIRGRPCGKESEEDEDKVCAVCLDDLNSSKKIGIVDCGHEFHVECITKWLMKKNVCPLCRATALGRQRH